MYHTSISYRGFVAECKKCKCKKVYVTTKMRWKVTEVCLTCKHCGNTQPIYSYDDY